MHRSTSRRRFLHATAAAGLAAHGVSGQAQDASVARLIFGLAPGAAGSRLADAAVQQLASLYAPPLKLEYVLGKESRRSVEVVKAAGGDGTTLLHCQSAAVSLFPNTYRNLGYAPLADLTPVACLGAYTFMLVVGTSVPASIRTVDAYLAWVADNPEARNIGVVLKGSQGQLAAMALAREKNAGLRPLPYSGTAPIVKDLLGGELAAAFVVTGNAQAEIADGRVRVLTVSSSTRWVGLPDVPTLQEVGVPELNLTGWYGWFGPATLNAAVQDKLAAAVAQLQAKAEFQAVQQQLQLRPLLMTPVQMRERIAAEIDFYAGAVKQARLAPMV